MIPAASDEQNELRTAVLEFAQDTLGNDQIDVVGRDHAGEFSHEAWRACADFGVLKWRVPTARGGEGHGPLTVVRLMEALGEGCRDQGLTLGLGAHIWGCQTALLRYGTEDQLAAYLPGLMNGERICAFAVNETSSGSDAFGIETTAEKNADGYTLNGAKEMITFAPLADFSIVFAKTSPESGRWGVSAFLVDANAPGYEARPAEQKMGLRTVPFGGITFNECLVPHSSLLGKEGAGASIFSDLQRWESFVLAPQVGAMARQLDECVEVARDRKRAGVGIGKHQAVSHRIANMKLRLETARLLLYKAAAGHEHGKGDPMEAALTTVHLAEAFTESSLDAIAIHGGAGYKTETQIERDLRDALGGMMYGGTVDVQRNIVAGLLGL